MDPHNKARKLIEARIRNLVGEFDFNKRKEKFPNECPCYLENKPCHDIPEENLNCFLCYCPEYNLDLKSGGCKLGNPQGKGKWFHHDSLPEGRIWDCSDCNYPHNREVAEKYFKKMFGVEGK